MAESETLRKGRELRRQLMGDAYVERINQTVYADPIMKKFVDVASETVFGALWTRPGLDLKTRSMLTVAALTVLGKDDYLRRHIQGALHVGVTPEELKEILMQMAFYGGIPCALKGLRIAHEEITAREQARG